MAIQDSDLFLLNHAGASYNVRADELEAKMADNDLMLVNRESSGQYASYKADKADVFGGTNVIGYATIASIKEETVGWIHKSTTEFDVSGWNSITESTSNNAIIATALVELTEPCIQVMVEPTGSLPPPVLHCLMIIIGEQVRIALNLVNSLLAD